MGKTILTPKQLDFLELAQKDKAITTRFYLTGGTALAEFYLKHRYSEDIDLFIEKEEVDPTLAEAFIKRVSPALNIVEYKPSQFLGLVSFLLIYNERRKLLFG